MAACILMTITDELVELLDQVLPISEGKPPVEVKAWLSSSGNFRRVRADYGKGKVLTIHFGARGQVTSAKASLSTSVAFGKGR